MPKFLDWDSQYRTIYKRYVEEGLSLTEVRRILHEDHGFLASERAYRERFRIWDFPSKQPKLHLDSELVERIKQLWDDNYSSRSMLHSLQRPHPDRKSYPELTKRQLDYIRHRNRILLGRGTGQARKDATKEKARSIVEKGLREGQTLRYGQVYMSTYVRTQGGMFISEKDLREVIQEVDPKGVQNRRIRRLHKRERYGVPGPNRVWSIDGHDKLSHFGFEIYGCIDAYSRCIMWCFVVPFDSEGERQVSKAKNPDLEFYKIYSFGTSTRNQRIEAWWRLLAEGKTDTYRTLFERLETDNLFNGGAIDKTAMQFIYMDIIRSAIHDFVEIHNRHRIRNQRQRESYLPTGRPKELYNDPPTGVTDYGAAPTEFVLEALLDEVKGYDLEEYLVPETRVLCQDLLRAKGMQTEYTFEDDHVAAYLVLRKELVLHFETNGGEIQLLPKPVGAMDWIEEQKEIEAQKTAYIEQQQSSAQTNQQIDKDFLLYQTDDEDPSIVHNYNAGREAQIVEAKTDGDTGSETEEDDDGVVFVIP
ncbi:hypothetical protein BJ508DRAFT_313480 [Ascobolus immersus RN42]|uniref:Uncharacterized protein n=1 Tax=Ascobolus immersus RN42 TaxID=1160509 RepID=A0A3N4HP01_ASCIM|nr:hypothetical protein BJ508DRAFT_313480 [Ascobolus immersus RN42]